MVHLIDRIKLQNYYDICEFAFLLGSVFTVGVFVGLPVMLFDNVRSYYRRHTDYWGYKN